MLAAPRGRRRLLALLGLLTVKLHTLLGPAQGRPAAVGEQRKVSADGNFAWLEVECLGACCNAPMVQINDDYFEDLTPENFEKLLDDLAAGRPVSIGSQTGRRSSEPAGKLTTLVSLYGEDGLSGPASAKTTA